MSRGPVWLFLAMAAAAAAVSAAAPIEVAMLGVLAFAGPHNWFELRYLVARLPTRLSVFRAYFVTAAAGLLLLSAGSFALAWLGRSEWAIGRIGPLSALWHTGLIAWTAALVAVRRRERPGRPIGWLLPAALVAASVAWLSPGLVGLALVYAHPLVALWILDREIRARHRELRSHYRAALWVVPAALALIWWIGPVPEAHAAVSPAVVDAIRQQSGADLLAADPGRRMVASHAFLELLHYGVWIALVPLLGVRGRMWRLRDVPIGRVASWRRLAVGGALAIAAGAAAVLWIGFSVDYAATRDLYFTVAIVHVLVEIPALIRLT